MVLSFPLAVSGCDWMCEPWVEFDGVRSKVTASANGAPTGWQLNGTVHVTRRMAQDCQEQTLTMTCDGTCGGAEHESARHSCAASKVVPPDAVVHIGSQPTSLGGSQPSTSTNRHLWHADDRMALANVTNGLTLWGLIGASSSESHALATTDHTPPLQS